MTAKASGKAIGIILLSLLFHGFLAQHNRANGCHQQDDRGDFKGQGIFAVKRQVPMVFGSASSASGAVVVTEIERRVMSA